MNKIDHYLEYFKRSARKIWCDLYRKNYYTEKQYELFQSLQVGDIVYAQMPLSDWEISKVPEGHKNRPYLIVGKDEKHIYGFPSTHKKLKKSFLQHYYISKEKYPVFMMHDKIVKKKQMSYFDLQKERQLSIEHLISYSSTLDEDDLKQIEKRILITEELCKEKRKHFRVWVEPQIGDIVWMNKNYWYVFKRNGQRLFCHPLSKESNENSYEIIMNKETYSIQLDSYEIFENVKKYRFSWILEKKDIDTIQKEKNRIKQQNAKTSKGRHVSQSLNFKHKTGTVFYMKFLDEHFVYLFSHGNSDFGILLEDYEEGKIRFYKEYSLNYMQKKSLMKYNKLNQLLYGLSNMNLAPICHASISYVYDHYPLINQLVEGILRRPIVNRAPLYLKSIEKYKDNLNNAYVENF